MSDNLAIKFMLIDAASAGIRVVGKEFTRLDGQGKQLAATWEKATQDIQRGAKAVLSAKALFDRGLKPGIQVSADLQESLHKLEATLTDQVKPLSQVREEIAAIERTAGLVGNPLPLDKTQLIEAATQLKKMGLEVDNLTGKRGAVGAASFLSVLEGISPQQAAEMVGDIGTQFSLLGEQYFDLTDQMSRAASASSTSAGDLGQALSFVGGSAARLGIQYKDVLATLALEAKVGLKGSRGGTALEAFLGSIAGKQSADAKAAQKKLGLNFFEGGQFVGMGETIKRLQVGLKGLNAEQRELALSTIFGTEGSRAASAFLGAEGGLDGILAQMDKQLTIEDKVAIQLKGHKGQWEAIKGTLTSTVATGLTPMLDVITAAETRAAGLASNLNEAVSNSPGAQMGISGGAGAAVAGLGIYGILKMAAGGLKGLSALKGLRALPGASTAAGIAAGKAAEQLGVQPVFVTNWPGGGVGGGGAGAALAEGAAAGAGFGLLGKGKALLGRAGMAAAWGGQALLGMGGMAAGAGAGAAGLAATGGVALGGLALGAGVGTAINAVGEHTGANDWAREGLAKALASLGSEWGRRIAADYEASRPLNVTVNIDDQGRATVQTEGEGLDTPRVMARRGGAR